MGGATHRKGQLNATRSLRDSACKKRKCCDSVTRGKKNRNKVSLQQSIVHLSSHATRDEGESATRAAVLPRGAVGGGGSH